MSYGDLVAEDQRRVILDALEQDADYSHNEDILRSILEHFGHTVSRDKLRTELSWLAEQGLVTVSVNGDVYIVRLTARGEDIALGRATIPGVKRPRL